MFCTLLLVAAVKKGVGTFRIWKLFDSFSFVHRSVVFYISFIYLIFLSIHCRHLLQLLLSPHKFYGTIWGRRKFSKLESYKTFDAENFLSQKSRIKITLNGSVKLSNNTASFLAVLRCCLELQGDITISIWLWFWSSRFYYIIFKNFQNEKKWKFIHFMKKFWIIIFKIKKKKICCECRKFSNYHSKSTAYCF